MPTVQLDAGRHANAIFSIKNAGQTLEDRPSRTLPNQQKLLSRDRNTSEKRSGRPSNLAVYGQRFAGFRQRNQFTFISIRFSAPLE
ncbi:hypothetical protein CGZ80_23370 [Rhodopirellula sp. MGV]|nr:hypothetical protein CGZ80_23370 [Rhodopirellula sp. MGV]PNY33419.1 hypothetical protein C2E31_28385 [Rhodopirellula baltica]